MIEPSTTVISWYMPEIERLVADLAKYDYPSETFRQNYSPGLDDRHVGLLYDYRVTGFGRVFDLSVMMTLDKEMPFAYYVNGSSEALFHLLVRHRTVYPQVPLYQFDGEYQGYNEYARCLGASFTNVAFGQDLRALPRGVFFISVPSAVDGNIVDDSVIAKICETHACVIDCAYAGMADMVDHKLNLHPNVVAIVGSMSKPFGLYYHRIGFVWSRDPIMSLYGNKWFKNIFSIVVGEEVLAQYSAPDLADTYRPMQKLACAEASELYGVEVKPSDVWLLGHVLPSSEQAIPSGLAKFKRGPGYRLCLTPYYMHHGG